MPSPITVASSVRWNKPKKDGTIPIKIRITFKRQSKELPTSLYAEPSQLNRYHEIKDPVLHDKVDDLVRSVRNAATAIDPFAIEDRDVHYVASLIEKQLTGGAKSFSLDFPTYFEKIASEKDKYNKASQMSALRSLSDFLGTEHFISQKAYAVSLIISIICPHR